MCFITWILSFCHIEICFIVYSTDFCRELWNWGDAYPCPECDGFYPEPLTALEIVETANTGAVSLGADGTAFHMAESIVITVDVQNKEPYSAKLSEAGTFRRGETPVPGNFVDSITFPTTTELDEGAIAVAPFVYTTQAEWLSDTQIGKSCKKWNSCFLGFFKLAKNEIHVFWGFLSLQKM